MLSNHSRIILGIFILSLIFIGLTTLEFISYTGKAIYEQDPPLISALFNLKANQFEKELTQLTEKDSKTLRLNPIKSETEGDYLRLTWARRVNKISIYMRSTNKPSKFEIWGPDQTKIASGKITNEFRWYTFELNDDMVFDEYALFNYGPSEIEIDQVKATELPESKINKLIGILTEGFI